MDIIQAFRLLDEGHTIARRAWEPGRVISKDTAEAAENDPITDALLDAGATGFFRLQAEDGEANDWYVVGS